MAVDITRYPTGDVSCTDLASTNAGVYYSEVDDVSADDNTTHIYKTIAGTDDVDGFAQLSFPALNVPAGATINYVRIVYRSKYTGTYSGAYASVGPYLWVGGSGYAGTRHSNAAWTTDSQDWTVNPKTGVAWSVDDVNGAGGNALQYFGAVLGNRYNGDSKNPAYSDGDLTQVYLIVNYTAAAPTVTTQAVSDIGDTAAIGNGTVTSDGGATITERGVCWKTSTGPTTADSKATASGTTGAFTADMTSLSPGQHYYVRAYAINSVGTSYGSEVEFTAATAVEMDITSIGLASGDALVQDIKGSITTWTKDGTATGHFNVANSAVEPGCLITFADASTATIVSKSGDGTGASSVTLSADHATDASLTSITGLIYSAPNLTIPSGVFNETVVGNSSAGDTFGLGESTAIFLTVLLPNSKRLVKVGAYSTTTTGTITWKVAQDNGGGSYTLTNLETIAHNQSGYQEHTLATPYNVPASGTFYLAAYSATTYYNIEAGESGTRRQYKTGDQTGTQTGWAGDAYAYHCTARHDTGLILPTALFAAHTNVIQLNTASYSSIDGIAATQVLNGASIWHAASVNKGNSAEKWWVYLSSVWRDIVQLSSGTWYYKDAGGSWQSATVQSRLGAQSQAFGVAQNQMSATALAAITEAQWATIFVAGTFDLAVGLQASGTSIPTLDKWTVTVTEGGAAAAGYAAGNGPGKFSGASAWGYIIREALASKDLIFVPEVVLA